MNAWQYTEFGKTLRKMKTEGGYRGLTYTVNAFFLGLAWILLPLGSENYRPFRENFFTYYPQLQKGRGRFFDFLRVFLQSVYFFLTFGFSIRNNKKKTQQLNVNRYWLAGRLRPLVNIKIPDASNPEKIKWSRLFLLTVILALSFFLLFLCITQPFELTGQLFFLSAVLAFALWLSRFDTKPTLLLLMVISTAISARYIWWRCTSTINSETTAVHIMSLALVMAEIYAFLVMVLGFFQNVWTLDRKPYPMPRDTKVWPTVDVYIPTYNEPLDIVRGTVLAALSMDWPKEKLKVYILDDGSRQEFEVFAKEVGAGYIKREKHDHAKAGNINHALGLTNGEYVAIFDCDHLPTRSFLQMTCGWLVKNPKIGLVQTPHHFYSQDPFEKNLDLKSWVPNENSFFHDFVQSGNDTWNATFFCGSCAVIRRKALEDIGGIAIETVTEDAHSSLKMNRKGWSSAFINIPLAAGLATESLSAHIGQRIRWARGMIQVLRVDNPLFGKGLSLPQRLCFFNGMLHFLHGLPRLIFLLAPLPFIFGNVYIIYASGALLFSYMVPHMAHSLITNNQLQRNRRLPFLSGVYETILSWYIFVPTTIALIFPKLGKFNVTVKGGLIDKKYLDKWIALPFLVLYLLNIAGLFYGVYRLLTGTDTLTVFINLCWIVFNILILGASISVAEEASQHRRFPRVNLDLAVNIVARGIQFSGTLKNYSQHGCFVKLNSPPVALLPVKGENVQLLIHFNGKPYFFDAVTRYRNDKGELGLELVFHSWRQEKDFVSCTFGRADMWVRRTEKTEDCRPQFWLGWITLCELSYRGLIVVLNYLPPYIRVPLCPVRWLIEKIPSFLPRRINLNNGASGSVS